MPDESEVHGLLALMLLARLPRRDRSPARELVLLADQDRSLWNREQIAAGRDGAGPWAAGRSAAAGPTCCRRRSPSLQAEHRPDWPQIAALYARAGGVHGSPVVELNRAVAVAEAGAPEAALAIVTRSSSTDYRYLHSTRAELLAASAAPDEAAPPTVARWS